MKMIEFARYGTPDVLKVVEVEQPVPADDEVLVKVGAASINEWDNAILGGDLMNRLLFGVQRPKLKTLGADIAGRVESVGKGVTTLRPGDEVWGDLCEARWGGLAEYVCAPEKALALKPVTMSFTEAAAVPQAGLLALQGLRDFGKVQAGQTVLINGAGGGVGTFAIQIAKATGAEVTAVDSAGKLDVLRAIGADHVIDYRQQDFTEIGRRYDLILDVGTTRSAFAYLRALNAGGMYVTVGGHYRRLFQIFALGGWIKRTTGKSLRVLPYRPNQGLDALKALIEAGRVRSVIDGPYALADAPAAFRHYGLGEHRGKVVIAMDALAA